MSTAKILLPALFCAVLAACARPRYPLSEPYVAVRGGSPIIGKLTATKFSTVSFAAVRRGTATKPETIPAVSAMTAISTKPI